MDLDALVGGRGLCAQGAGTSTRLHNEGESERRMV